MLNNDALHAHSSGSGSGLRHRRPQYGDMLWPVFDNTGRDAPVAASTIPVSSGGTSLPPDASGTAVGVLTSNTTSDNPSLPPSSSSSTSLSSTSSSATSPSSSLPTAAVDVVLVHGLMGGPLLTWRVGGPRPTPSSASPSPSGGNDAVIGAGAGATPTTTKMWPVEWLARDLARNGVAARIVSVEYNGNLLAGGQHAHPPRDLYALAPVLRKQLQDARTLTVCEGVV